jgi:hypothetical protein
VVLGSVRNVSPRPRAYERVLPSLPVLPRGRAKRPPCRVFLARKSSAQDEGPPDGKVLWLKRVRVLGVMYALQKSGMTREAAAKHISTQRPDLKCLMTRGKYLPQAIQRWARELDEAKPGTLLGEYSEQRIEIETKKRLGRESLEPSEWRQFADNFLAGIRPNPGI